MNTLPLLYSRACIQNKEMQERVGSMGPLFLTVFINTVLEDFGGRYTDFLRVDSLFWAGGGRGRAVGVFKG